MVPPHWEHPMVRNEYGGKMMTQPMFDQRFEDASAEWKSNFAAWESKTRADRRNAGRADEEFWEYEPPPERKNYRPWHDHEATWFQVWETVSLGTPVTPPFATKQELIEYLVANGDFWDQERRRRRDYSPMPCAPWSREEAERLVNVGGSTPTLVVENGDIRLGWR